MILRTIIVISTIAIFLTFIVRIKQYLSLKALKLKLTKKKLNRDLNKIKIIGFFHPNCDAGAGGEKVLWQAVKAL
jgi:alpha-1,2-mannosyltransferase